MKADRPSPPFARQIHHYVARAFKLGTQEGVSDEERIPHFKRHLRARARAEGKPRDHYTHGMVFTPETYEEYLKCALRFGAFVERAFGITDLYDVLREHISAFMRRGIEQRGWAKRTAKVYSSALGKLGAAIGRHDLFSRPARRANREASFSNRAGRPVLSDTEFEQVLAYMTAAGESRGRLLAARIAHAGGLRLIEVTTRWGGLEALQERGFVTIRRGKGGRPRRVEIPVALWDEVFAFHTATGARKLDRYGAHLDAWREACKALGFVMGTHARRRRHSQAGFGERLASGMTVEQAEAALNQDMGHGPGRRDIPDTYLMPPKGEAPRTLMETVRALQKILRTLQRGA